MQNRPNEDARTVNASANKGRGPSLWQHKLLKTLGIAEKETSVPSKLPEIMDGHCSLVGVGFAKVARFPGPAKAKGSLIATNRNRSC